MSIGIDGFCSNLVVWSINIFPFYFFKNILIADNHNNKTLTLNKKNEEFL